MYYEKLVSQRQSSFNLNKESAIINNISKGRILEAEIIAKKSLVPKESSLMQVYRRQRELSSPLYNSFVRTRPAFKYDQLSHAFMQAIKDVEQDSDNVREDSPTIEEVIEEPTPVPPMAFQKIGDKMFMEVDIRYNLEYMNVDELGAYVSNYTDKLDQFINHMSNTRATDAMKQHSIFDSHQNAFQWSLEYARYLDNYLQFRRKLQKGESIMTNLEDVYEPIKILVGEITSGNKNKNVMNEFRDIIYYLYKHNHISKNNYDALMKT